MGKRKKVLIVESDERAAEDVAVMVRKLDHEAIVLQQGQILALLFIEVEPDVVIIYRKQFIKNRQLFIEGTKRLSDARLIITSGAYLNGDRINELGVDCFLQKPVASADLEEIISHCEVFGN